MARLRRFLRRLPLIGRERGMALMLTLMVMMLMSALMVGFITAVMADQRSSGVDRDQTQAYAVAHAGMEKLTSDLAALFTHDYSPSGTAINALATHPPVIAGFQYLQPDSTNGYYVTFTADGSGNPTPDDPTTGTTVAAGPYQGFKGIVTHYNIMVTSRSSGGAEVRMRRELQTVAVPVFQFGLFSESSLSFHAGSDYNFGGRIHTNGNLFLTSGNGSTLTLGDKVTAVGEVVRTYLDNGISATGNWSGTVSMAKGTGVYRNLAATEGSVTGNACPLPALPPPAPACTLAGLGSALNDPTWTTVSVGTYNGYIRNGRTGAKRLDLPLVSNGAQPIDLIKRAPVNEDVALPLVFAQRYFSQASLRILISDLAADMTALPTVTATAPVGLDAGTYKTAPLATAGVGGTYRSTATTPLIGGVIKIEKQNSTNVWSDVTAEILGLGVTGKNLSNGTANTPFTGANARNGTLNGCLGSEPNPDAVIRLQRVKDVPSTDPTNVPYRYDCAYSATGLMSVTSTDYWPLALYDPREGVKRDEAGANSTTSIVLGGVMYYVELDTNNLAKWFRGTTGTTGTQAKNDNNGYIVYFSDRRNNRNGNGAGAAPSIAANAETGEYGNEDIINPTTNTGTTTGTLDPGEDVNGNGVLETYGNLPSYGGASNSAPPGAASPLHGGARANDVLAGPASTYAAVLRGNRPIFFRRALKLTGGTALRTSGINGLTIASENPVYVQGNYNSTAGNTPAETHIAASVIADAITLLSNSWNDINSFSPSPHDPTTKPASDTGYRFAAVAGKTIAFAQPTNWGASPPEPNFGMDGGAHNLFRLIENWSGTTTYYRGSMVSFYISRQATGIYKNGQSYVYNAPTRVYNFDTDFLLPSLLPPGTPMFRDVNTLTFRQLLRPNQ